MKSKKIKIINLSIIIFILAIIFANDFKVLDSYAVSTVLQNNNLPTGQEKVNSISWFFTDADSN